MKSRHLNGLTFCAISLVALGVTACSGSDGNTIPLELNGGSLALQIPDEIRTRNTERNALADRAVIRNVAVLIDDTNCIDLAPRRLSDSDDYSREIANAVGGLVNDGSPAIKLFVQWFATAGAETVLIFDGQYDLGVLTMVAPDAMVSEPSEDPTEPDEVSLLGVDTGCLNGAQGVDLESMRFDTDEDGLSNLEELNAGVPLAEIVGDTEVMVQRSGANMANMVLNASDPIVLVDASSNELQDWSTLEQLILCRVEGGDVDGTLASAFENSSDLEQPPVPACPRTAEAAGMSGDEVGQLPELSIGSILDANGDVESLQVVVSLAHGSLMSVVSNGRTYTDLNATLNLGGSNAGADSVSCVVVASSDQSGGAGQAEGEGATPAGNNATGLSVTCPIALNGSFMVNNKAPINTTFMINGNSADGQSGSIQTTAAWNLRQASLLLY